ncbi:MAG: EAL domain-containing protein [Mycobacteriales bacterium]
MPGAPQLDQALLRLIVEKAPEGIWLVGAHGETLFVNEYMAVLLGLSVAELSVAMPLDRLAPPDRELLLDRLRNRERLGPETYELRYAHPDGRPRLLRAVAVPLYHSGGPYVGSLGIVSDITAERARENAVRRMVFRDELTGLASRRLMLDRLDRAAVNPRLSTHIGVLFADLDRFSLVNDARGLEAGDAALQAVGRRLRDLTGDQASVGRMGGDEFLVLLEGADLVRSVASGEELVRAVGRPVELPPGVEGGPLHLSVSVGVAVGPAAQAWELTRHARAALQQAKQRGGNQVATFDPAQVGELHQRLTVGGDLRQALLSEQLAVAFQPIIELTSGRLVAVEALARWQHPTLGSVSPTIFVAIAEEIGMGAELDSWVLGKAASDFARLRATGALEAGTVLNVNMGASRLEAEETVTTTIAICADCGLPPTDLCVEVTETQAMNDPGAAAHVLRLLREAGVRVAIDDFGTGHSSLAHLRRFPADYLKIEGSFVEQIATSADDLAIVASIVDLARVVGMRAVAEGVESAEQLALLRRLGCYAGQGFLWSPALTPQALVDLLTSLPGARFVSATATERALRFEGWDADVAPAMLERVMELHATGASLTTIAAALNAEGLRTASGRRWHRTSVARVVAREAYRDS